MSYTVKVPGSCGELAQGYLNNSNFLISCPIDIYSSVTVEINKENEEIIIEESKNKTKEALNILRDYYDLKNIGLQVKINSNLPRSKGLGSSTADMSAALIAAVKELDLELDLNQIKNILLRVEPSDATFLEGINLFDHIEGSMIRFLGNIEPIPLLVFDYGGKVDTLAFNTRVDLDNLNRGKSKQIEKAYNLISKGVKNNNKEMIGKGATISSLANQIILKKTGLERLVKGLEQKEGFLGVNIAHSGTVLGIMVKDPLYFDDIIDFVGSRAPQLKLLFKTKIVNGGYKTIKNEG